MVKTEFDSIVDSEAGAGTGEPTAQVEIPDGAQPYGDDFEPTEPEEVPPPPLGQNESIAGLSMVAVVLAGGLYFHWRPGQTIFDTWGFSLIHPALANSMWQHITWLAKLPVIVGGSILAALVVVHRDRWRALACLVGPIVALMIAEWVLKDSVGRRYAEVVSYPSGTVTAVSSLGAAWIVAVTRRIRPWVTILVTFIVGIECMAVTALLWHFPTDAIAGAVFGAGAILMIDGLLHLAVGAVRRRREENKDDALTAPPPSMASEGPEDPSPAIEGAGVTVPAREGAGVPTA